MWNRQYVLIVLSWVFVNVAVAADINCDKPASIIDSIKKIVNLHLDPCGISQSSHHAAIDGFYFLEDRPDSIFRQEVKRSSDDQLIKFGALRKAHDPQKISTGSSEAGEPYSQSPRLRGYTTISGN